jgi:hypothetical protein
VSDPALEASTQAPPAGPADLSAWLETLRGNGGWRVDPARFHAMDALSRRLPGLQEPVRGLLQDKLQAAAAHYAARLAQAAPRPAQPPRTRRIASAGGSNAAATPLSQLNDYIRAATAARRAPDTPGEPHDEQELASARRFRQARARGRALDQVEGAAARRPANAGPLNSHALVLHSLDLMRELSTDYLRRFLSHVESLQWLDQAREHSPRAEGKQAKPGTPAKRGRRKK